MKVHKIGLSRSMDISFLSELHQWRSPNGITFTHIKENSKVKKNLSCIAYKINRGCSLKLGTLGTSFSKRHFKILYFFFRQQDLTFNQMSPVETSYMNCHILCSEKKTTKKKKQKKKTKKQQQQKIQNKKKKQKKKKKTKQNKKTQTTMRTGWPVFAVRMKIVSSATNRVP